MRPFSGIVRGTLIGAALWVLLWLWAVAAFGGPRVEIFSPDGHRIGAATMDHQTGRIDLYDAAGRRLGWGTVRPGGVVELFDLQGRRQQDGAVWIIPRGGEDAARREPLGRFDSGRLHHPN